jgi:hypothetical protein
MSRRFAASARLTETIFSTVRLDSYDSVAESLWQRRADIS